MAMKRKRKPKHDHEVSKRRKVDSGAVDQSTWPLLRQYYPKVLTLRQHVASRLSKTSKKRQRKLSHYGFTQDPGDVDESLVNLLDHTVIGTFNHIEIADVDAIDRDITVFTQQLSESTATISPTQSAFKQSEIVDFAIWLLFRRHQGAHKPSHILCHGYQRYASGPNNGAELLVVPGVPGIWSNGSNKHVEDLKSHPWCALTSLLGNGAERILSDLFMHCGIFEPVPYSSNLSQLSGVPLCELRSFKTTTPAESTLASCKISKACLQPDKASAIFKRGLSDIRLVRHRMLYAKPVHSAKGRVQFGLSPLHALNRQRKLHDQEQAVHLLKYVFPLQFGLHNVFTSDVDPKDTAQPFQDYHLRETEIAQSTYRWRQRQSKRDGADQKLEPPLPKRLRGQALELVARMRKRQTRCSYSTLLDHYCPGDSGSQTSLQLATSTHQVSAFCRSAISRVFPHEFWGTGQTRAHNWRVLARAIDDFVRMRRYESITLHDVLQNIVIQGVQWLAPQHVNASSKMSATDFAKRKELTAEVLYYLLDSFLIPLIRGHFHVTESGVHRNQLFYFRHDVWKAISEPALATLKSSMLEPCNTIQVKAKVSKRALGVSQVRLLPKEHGMRPIINLRRRVQKLERGQLVLGKSINSVLTPTFTILNYEKSNRPEILASALFSVEDMYPRLQAFRQSLEKQGFNGRPLYFAKVDVKACFDTIPQKRLMKLVRTVIGTDTYHITKFARAKLVGGHNQETPGFGAKPSWRYLTKAMAGGKEFDLGSEIEADTADGRTRTIYVDGVAQKDEHRKAILSLLDEHVESNLIKLGNRFYRQKEGIPQGSIVSSLLCSYFYAELERDVLGFVNDGQSMMLRLIDDFLVISTKPEVTNRFMRVMHAGLPEFGVEVKAEKSRANFDVEIDGTAITRLPSETDFPYCGNAINTVTLDLSKDKERRKKSNIPDSMSVEYSKLPGQTFYRKTLNALKLQMHAMLFSTAYNSLQTVLSNLHHSFTEVAQKSYHYIRSLPLAKQPSGKLVIKTVEDVIKLACVLMKRRKSTSKDILPYSCSVSNIQARWLACTAFRDVFQRRQTRHGVLLAWLKEQLELPGLKAQRSVLEGIVK